MLGYLNLDNCKIKKISDIEKIKKIEISDVSVSQSEIDKYISDQLEMKSSFQLFLLIFIGTCIAVCQGITGNACGRMQYERERLVSVRAGGDCGEHVTWTLNADGVLRVRGTGPMTNYSADHPSPWNDKKEKILKIIVDEGVTTIGNYSFFGLSEVKTASVPYTVKVLGNYCFASCTKLESFVQRLPGQEPE